MKTPSFIRKSAYSALMFFWTLGILSAGYAGFVTLQSSDADSGKSLTSTMMQAVIGNLADLDSRVGTMSGVVSGLSSSIGGLSSNVTSILTSITSLSNNIASLSGTVSTLQASGGVPTGAVMAFYGAVCPSGWSPADGTAGGVKKTDGTTGTLDLRGEFIRGLDVAGAGARLVDSGRTLGTWQNFQSTPYDNVKIDSNSYWTFVGWPLNGSAAAPSVDTANYTIDRVTKNYRSEFETRPRNVALLYCVKN